MSLHARLPIKYAGAAPESARDLQLTAAHRLITDLLRCVTWLLQHGIYVIGFDGRQRSGVSIVTVRVAASPYLYKMFGEDCCWRTRRQEGALTIYTWAANRFGIRIEWEEVSCAA